MTDHNVSNASELATAISNAVSGDNIICADANYGDVVITSKAYTSNVTIQATNSRQAIFETLDITSSSYVRCEGIHFKQTVAAGSNTSPMVDIITDGDNISFDDCEFSGPTTGDRTWLGIKCDTDNKITNVSVTNCYFHDLFRGVSWIKVDDVTLDDCIFKYIGEDAVKVSSIGGTRNNFRRNQASHWRRVGSFHCDFFQFEGTGSKSNITLQRNILLLGDSGSFAGVQGILGNAGSWSGTNYIQENIFYTCNINNIQIDSSATGMNVDRNSAIHPPASLYSPSTHTYTSISSPGTESNNLDSTNGAGSSNPDGIKMSTTVPADTYYQGTLITNPDQGYDATIADLLPVTGQPAEGEGAWDYMQELLAAPSSRTFVGSAGAGLIFGPGIMILT